MSRRFFLALSIALAAGVSTPAQAIRPGGLQIDQVRARATLPNQPVGGGYLRITNNSSADDRLLSASAYTVAQTTELHSMAMEGDVMRMRPVDAIALPRGKAVELKPGGLHLMFMGLKAPLNPGDTFPLRLRFEKAGEITVEVTVDAMAAGGR
jgi:copper(I)-binding protein